jgi:hypothetical protein
MSAKSKMDWFWSDWLGDQAVRRLTPAERGVWIDLVGLASCSNPIGYVCDETGMPLTNEEIARVTNAGSASVVAELIDGILSKGAASRDRTGRLFNRRMIRDAELRAKKARAGRKGAEHTNLINQQLRGLTRQMPRHLPQQNIHGPPGPFPKKERKTSSELGTARASSTEPSEVRPTAPQASGETQSGLPRKQGSGLGDGRSLEQIVRDKGWADAK